MKYIKTYEGIKDWFKRRLPTPLFEVGQYVLVDLDKFGLGGYHIDKGVIVDISPKGDEQIRILKKLKIFYTFSYDVKMIDDDIFTLRENEIVRDLTKEEIEQFEIEKEAKKYNL